MSKTSVLLLCIFIIALGIFGYIKLTHPYIPAGKPVTKVLQISNQPSKSIVSFSPAVFNAYPGKTNSIAVNLNVQGDVPTLVQVEIGYDPTIITPLTISPGTFFNQPTVLLNTMDPGSGRISYALQCGNAKTCIHQANADVATLTFSINPYTIKKETEITFFPKTLLQTADGLQTKLQTQNAKIIIVSAANVVPPASSSAHIKPL